MKKYIAIFLVLVLTVFSFAACNKESGGNDDNTPVEKFDEEKLKETWKEGEVTFANGNKVSFPCTVNDVIEASGMNYENPAYFESVKIEAGETETVQLESEDTKFKIDCKNSGKEAIGIGEASVTGFNFYNAAEGNKKITVSAGLTVGILRKDVEDALGIPEGKTPEDKVYTYKSETANGQKMRLSVSFNSSGQVNSISYKLDK